MSKFAAAVIVLVGLSVPTVGTFAEDAPEIPLVSPPPSSDGVLSPGEWAKGLHVTEYRQFQPQEGLVPQGLRTEAWIGRTETALCFAVRAYHDQMGRLVTAAKEHDGPAWTDDSVEVFIDAQKTEFSYYHLIVTAAGIVYDAFNDGPGQAVVPWDSGARAATQLLPDGFSLEVAVPLAVLNLGTNTPGGIGLNLGRVVPYNRSQQTTFGQFHNPSSWEAFRLPATGPKLWLVAAKPFKFGAVVGANQATGEVRNLTDQPLALGGEAVIEQQGKRQTRPVSLKLAPRGKARVAIPYTLSNKGSAQFRLVWRDAARREVFAVLETIQPKAPRPVFVLPTR